MRKVISLGLHKTGSTSLQAFLGLNRWRLAQSGVLYPPTDPHSVGHMIAQGLGHTPPAIHMNDRMGHNALAYRLLSEADPNHPFPQVHMPMPTGDIALALMAQTARAMQANTLILCSEDFARLSFHAPTALDRLRESFGAENTHLMCTIRRPDHAIEAWQVQRLRMGQTVPRLTTSGITTILNSPHAAFRRVLEPWLTTYPDADLTLTNYADTTSKGGSVAHFTRQCGLDLPHDLTPPKTENSGLHPALFEIARLGADALPKSDAWHLLKWLETVEAHLTLPPRSQVEMLGQANRTRLADAFASTHAYLSTLVDRAAFFDDIDAIGAVKPIPVVDAAAACLTRLAAVATTTLPVSPRVEFLERLAKTGVPP